jgi:DNA repair exonuclease SbcCD ATPase subunit
MNQGTTPTRLSQIDGLRVSLKEDGDKMQDLHRERLAGEAELEAATAAYDQADAEFKRLASGNPPATVAALKVPDDQRRDAEIRIRAAKARLEDLDHRITERQRIIDALNMQLQRLGGSVREQMLEIVRREQRFRTNHEQLETQWHQVKARAAALKAEEAYIANLIESLNGVLGKDAAAERLRMLRQEMTPRFAGTA